MQIQTYDNRRCSRSNCCNSAQKKLYESNAGKPAPATEQEDFRKQKVELEDLRKEREKAAADMSKLQDDLAQRSRLVSSLQADLALTKSDACRVSRLERENEALQAKVRYVTSVIIGSSYL